MRSSAKLPTLCRIACILLVVLVLGGAAGSYATAAPAVTPIVVTIDKPSDRKTFPANAFVPISVKVASTGSITTVELWVDGILVDQKKPTGFQKRYSAHFSWQPGGKGEHSIVGRAVDESGAFADSKSVRITATGSVEPLALIDVRQGETLRTLADRLNAPIEQITALNPGISLNQSLQPGATLFAPLSPGNTASGGAARPVSASSVTAAGAQARAPGRASPVTSNTLSNSLRLLDGKLLVPETVDRVYYYQSLGDGQWRRVPEDPNAFIDPVSGEELRGWTKVGAPSLAGHRVFEVASKLGDLRAGTTKQELLFSLEAWGWAGDQLKYLGGFQQLVPVERLDNIGRLFSADSSLYVCAGSGCPPSDISIGWRSGEIEVARDNPNQKRQFLLRTDASGWDGSIVWQMATMPFGPSFDPAPSGLVASGVSTGNTFEIDFAHTQQHSSSAAPSPVASSPTPPPAGGISASRMGAGLQQNGLPSREDSPLSSVFDYDLIHAAGTGISSAASNLLNNIPATYYVRAVPMAGSLSVAMPSNSIVIHHVPGSKDDGVQIIDPNEKLPAIFDVEMLEFQTFNPSSSGCAKVIRNDLTSPMATVYKVGSVYCPPPFKGLGGKHWYEMLLDFASGGVDWIANAYDGVKGFVVDVVASAIPLCSDSDWCKGVLSAGLDAALVAAGVPPSLPSFAELEGMGEGYLIDYVAQQAGVDCGPGSLCQDAIKSAISQKKQQALAGGSNEACLPKDEANALGFEPMCLPPGVIGVPVEGSMPHPASVKVKVTRKIDSPDVSEEQYLRYQLGVGVAAVNPNYPAGKSIQVGVNYPRDSSTYALMCGMAPDYAYVTQNDTLSGSLFGHPAPGAPVAIMPSNLITPNLSQMMGSPALPVSIPRLAQGESAELTIPLAPTQPFWIPGHKKAIQDAGGAVCFDDWYRLYQGSQATAYAEIGCPPKNQWMTCSIDPPTSSQLKQDIPW